MFCHWFGGSFFSRHGNIEEHVAVACAEVLQKIPIGDPGEVQKVWQQETIELPPQTTIFQMDLAENPQKTGLKLEILYDFIMGWTHILDIEIPWVSESVDIAMFGAVEISACMDLMITRSSLTFSLQNHSEEKQLYNELLPSGFSLSVEESEMSNPVWHMRTHPVITVITVIMLWFCWL